MAKEIKFRGKSLEELKKMDLREFANLLKSRERRSLIRNVDVFENFLKRIQKKIDKKKPIKTHLRDLIIIPRMVGLTIKVHSGKSFVDVKISEQMLGHRLGEFVPTRGQVKHGAPGIGATRSTSFLSVK
ncbi:MAG: 30S ribosomal protein S19 [archaeon]|nr:MAG: 30S ribosomal protein S19 [archaeon]